MIRDASRFDLPDIIEMFLDFADSGAYSASARSVEFDVLHLEKIFFACLHQGFILVSEHDDELQGFLVAVRQSDVWHPEWIRLQELIWYVKPKYRNTTVGGKLFLEYNRRADSWIEQGIVKECSTTRMSTTPDLGLEKRGWQLTEKLYIKGAE